MPLVRGPACRLWVETIGDGDPVTIFAHGLSSSSQDLRALAGYVGGTRVLLDWRGHGHSESPPEDAGYDHAAVSADIDAVATMVDATHAVGVSMGANAIVRLLCENPHRFARAALIMASRLDDPCPDVPGTLRFADQIETGPLSDIADALMRLPEVEALIARDERWRAHLRGQLMRINRTGAPRAIRAYATGEPPLPDPECLRRVAVPLLVAGHENDPNHPAAVSRRIAALAANVTLRIWDDDFAMMLDDLDVFGRVVSSFLAGELVSP